MDFHVNAKVRLKKVTFDFENHTVTYEARINFNGIELPEDQMIINNTIQFSFSQYEGMGQLEKMIMNKIGENIVKNGASNG